jgi:hypothetical protein
MTAIVPDTMQGALIVSVIDFFLSFLIISGIGFILSLFPLLNRAARFIASWGSVTAPVDIKPARDDKSELDDDIAALSAAVYVVMAGAPHRIINIQASQRRSSWVAEGRIAQHGSHAPRA